VVWNELEGGPACAVGVIRWNSRVVLHVMSMMRDIALSSEELSHVIAKSLRQMTEVELNELPPLVYQLLLLSAKVHSVYTTAVHNLYSYTMCTVTWLSGDYCSILCYNVAV